jgi:hypothetical protein
VAYTAVCNGSATTDFAARFVSTWHETPPGIETDLMIICNGGPLNIEQNILFSLLKAKMFPRSNDGWDIGGQIEAARGPCADYDIVLFAGESVYFHREGWLKRLVDAYAKHGPGMYGVFSSNNVRGHLQTTAYFCPPLLLRQYPNKVFTREDRYEYEHGERALWRRVASAGMPVRLVTWDGEWEPRFWRMPQNIHYRGNQSNCLMWCNHSDGYAKADPVRKMNWARTYDQPFK